jgi:hypothetical protein
MGVPRLSSTYLGSEFFPGPNDYLQMPNRRHFNRSIDEFDMIWIDDVLTAISIGITVGLIGILHHVVRV